MKFFSWLISVLSFTLAAHVHASPKDVEHQAKIEEMFAGYQKKFPDAPFVNINELFELMRDPKTMLVDVRDPAEQKVSMIYGSNRLVLAKDVFEKDEVKYKDRKIVIYCTIGYRSGLYTSKLRSRGFQAYNLKGGILAWANAHQSVIDAQGETKRVHVYGAKWNLLPADYEGVW